MSRVRFTLPRYLRACAVLLTVLCAHAQAQQLPNSVTIAGTFQESLGCANWDPACRNTHLDLDAEDGIWRKVFVIPGGRHEFKAVINGASTESYGANGQGDGANLVFGHVEPRIAVKFFYDPVTHWVTNSSITPIAVLAGSLQSELGCPGDWQPECMLTWLKDVDGDGVQQFSTSSLPPGDYELKVAHDESWTENYGAGGVPNGDTIPFTVPGPGQEARFSYDPRSHRLAVTVNAPTVTTLTVNPNPVTRGEALTLTAAVTVTQGTAVPTGSVTFRVDGAELRTVQLDSRGVATLTVPAFVSGTYALTADYNGTYVTSASFPEVILLTGVTTTTSLTVEPESAVFGEPIILTATVTPAGNGSEPLAGEVIFREKETVLATVPLDEGRQASFSPVDPPSIGTHTYTAELRTRVPHFASQSDAVEHTVNAAGEGGPEEEALSEKRDGGWDGGMEEDAGSEEFDAGWDAGMEEDAGSEEIDAGWDAGPEDAGAGDMDAGSSDEDAGSGPQDAGSGGGTDAGSGGRTDAGSGGGTDAGSGGRTDAGSGGGTDAGSGGGTDAGSGGGTEAGSGGGTDAGSGGGTDAGSGGGTDAGSGGGTDAGSGGGTDAGSGGGTDAGSGGGTDAGSGGGTDAGSGGGTDAGSGGGTDAGSGNTDAGTGNTDAGTNPGTDAGSGDTDAGTNPGTDAGTGNTDAGTQVPDAGSPPPSGDELPPGCACGASAGSSSTPFLMLGMWMALSVLQSRRRSRTSARE